ncbi:MAG: hypothetical protein P8Y03_24895 [Anaerolineales bacterium]|jgi:hypothetical protein
MSRKPVPVLFMSLMLVFVLASTGVAYGLWTQTLQILGAVTTDKLNVQWEIEPGSDAACTIPNPQDLTVVDVTLDDAVPGDEIHCYLKLVNNGNIPVEIISDEVIPISPLGWEPAEGSDYCAPPNANQGPIYINYVNGVGMTLAPGGETSTSLEICVEDYAVQNTPYEFKVEVLVEQQ